MPDYLDDLVDDLYSGRDLTPPTRRASAVLESEDPERGVDPQEWRPDFPSPSQFAQSYSRRGYGRLADKIIPPRGFDSPEEQSAALFNETPQRLRYGGPNGSRQFGETIEAPLRYTGNLLIAPAYDAAEAWSGQHQYTGFENMAAAAMGERKLPFDYFREEASKEAKDRGEGGWDMLPGDIGVGLAKSAPKIAAVTAAPGLGAQMVAGGLLFGLDDNGDWHPKEAAIGALLPGVGHVAKKTAAIALGKLIQGGVEAAAHPVVQKAVETLADQAALNAFQVAGDSPELVNEYYSDPLAFKKHMASIVGSNLGFMAFGVKNWDKSIPSETVQLLQEHADAATKQGFDDWDAKMRQRVLHPEYDTEQPLSQYEPRPEDYSGRTSKLLRGLQRIPEANQPQLNQSRLRVMMAPTVVDALKASEENPPAPAGSPEALQYDEAVASGQLGKSPAENQDYARYNDLWQQTALLNSNAPDYENQVAARQQEIQAIKNKYGGNPPPEPKVTNAAPAAEEIPASPKPSQKTGTEERMPDLIDELEGALGPGKRISLQSARELVEDFQPTGRLRKLFTKDESGIPVDDVSSRFTTASGALSQKSEGAGEERYSSEDFIRALSDTADKRILNRQKRWQEGRLIKQESKQADLFSRRVIGDERPQNAPAGQREPQKVPVHDLNEGDEFSVLGHKFVVEKTEIDQDGYLQSITLKDGPKFGVHTVSPGDAEFIHIDKNSLKTGKLVEFLPEEPAEPVQPKPPVGISVSKKEGAYVPVNVSEQAKAIFDNARKKLAALDDGVVQTNPLSLLPLIGRKLSAQHLEIYDEVGREIIKLGAKTLRDFTKNLIREIGESARPLATMLYVRAGGKMEAKDRGYANTLRDELLSSLPEDKLFSYLENISGDDLSELSGFKKLADKPAKDESETDAQYEARVRRFYRPSESGYTTAGSRRLEAITSLFEKYKTQRPQEQAAETKLISDSRPIAVDDLDFDSTALGSTEKTGNKISSEPAYLDIYERDLKRNPTKTLQRIVSGASGEASQSKSNTKRVVAFRDNVTGEVFVSSVYEDKTAGKSKEPTAQSKLLGLEAPRVVKSGVSERIKLVDPARKSAGKSYVNTSLADLLQRRDAAGKQRYTLVGSARLKETSNSALWKFRSVDEYNKEFADKARSVLEAAKSGAEQMERVLSAMSVKGPRETVGAEDENIVHQQNIEGAVEQAGMNRTDTVQKMAGAAAEETPEPESGTVEEETGLKPTEVEEQPNESGLENVPTEETNAEGEVTRVRLSQGAIDILTNNLFEHRPHVSKPESDKWNDYERFLRIFETVGRDRRQGISALRPLLLSRIAADPSKSPEEHWIELVKELHELYQHTRDGGQQAFAQAIYQKYGAKHTEADGGEANPAEPAETTKTGETARAAGESEKPAADKILAAIDKAIEFTTPELRQGALLEGASSLPAWATEKLVNSALKIVRAAYVGGKSMADSVLEAIDYLKEQKPDIDEKEAREWFRNYFDDLGVTMAVPKTEKQYELQKGVGEMRVPEKVIGALADPVSFFKTAADKLNLSERVRRVLGIPQREEVLALARAETPNLTNYEQARDSANTPGGRTQIVLGAYRELSTIQQRKLDLQRKLQRQEEYVLGQQFANRVRRMKESEARVDYLKDAAETFRNQVATEAAAVLKELQNRRAMDAEYDRMRADYDRLRQMPEFAEAVKQRVDRMVARLAGDESGQEILLNERPGEAIGNRYLELLRADGVDEGEINRERPFIDLASQVLSANRDLRIGMSLLDIARFNPDFKAKVTEVGEKFMSMYERNPALAIRNLLSRAQGAGRQIGKAEMAWLSLNRGVRKSMETYANLYDAVRGFDEVESNPGWKKLVNTVFSDAKAVKLPDVVLKNKTKQDIFNEFTGHPQFVSPDGAVYKIDLGFTKDSARQSWEQINSHLDDLENWLNDSANADNPDRTYWEAQRDFVESVYYASTTLNPSAINPLLPAKLSHSWYIPDYFFDQMQLPGAKVARVAFENFGAAANAVNGWVANNQERVINRLAVAAKAKGYDIRDGLHKYREDVINQIAWSYRNGRKLAPGMLLDNGITVTAKDIEAFKTQASAVNQLFSLVKSVGRERAMQDNLLLDDWSAKVFGIRKASELGAEPGTTLPHELSQRGKLLADAANSIAKKYGSSKQGIAAMEELLDQPNMVDFLRSFITQRKSSFVKELSPYEDLYKQLAAKMRAGDSVDSLQDIVDFVSSNVPPDASDNIKAEIVGEISNRLDRFYKNFVEKEDPSDIRAFNTEKASSLSRGFQDDVENSFFYDFGVASAADMRSLSMDATNFHLARVDRSLAALEQDLSKAMNDLRAAPDEGEFRKQAKQRHKSGDDFRDFERLQSQLNEVRRYREGIPSWSGRDSLEGALVNRGALNRIMTNVVGSRLTGWPTSLRVLIGSNVKMGSVFAAMDRNMAFAYAKSLASMAISTFKILPQVGARTGAKLVVNSPEALRAFVDTKGSIRLRSAEAIVKLLDGMTEEIMRPSKYLRDQVSTGLVADQLLGNKIANMILLPESRGHGYKGRVNSPTLKLLRNGFFTAVGGLEVPIEVLRSYLPQVAYSVAYDAAARQAGWTLDLLEMQARRAFDTHEKLGSLGKFNLDNPGDINNELRADEVLPHGLLLPKTQTALNVVRDWFRAIDVPYQESVLDFWKRLRDAEPDARKSVRLLGDNPDAAERRATALMAVALRDVHHASPTNRPWALRTAPIIRLFNPIIGWSSQSTRQFFSTLGTAASDKNSGRALIAAVTAVNILAFAGIATLNGDAEKRVMSKAKALLYNEQDTTKHLGEGESFKENAKIAVSDATSYISVLNTVINSMLGMESSRGGLNIQPMVVDEANNWLQLFRGMIGTGDFTYGLEQFAGQQVPVARTLLNRLPQRKGIVALKDASNVLRKLGPADLVKAPSGAMVVPTELSPAKDKLMNAVFSGDDDAIRSAYDNLVATAEKLGKSNPERTAQQIFQSFNPYRRVFGQNLDEDQRAEIMAKANEQEKKYLSSAEERYINAADLLGSHATLNKRARGGSGGSGYVPGAAPRLSSSSDYSAPAPRLSTPRTGRRRKARLIPRYTHRRPRRRRSRLLSSGRHRKLIA